MAAKGNLKRLRKVASEFNLGTSTIVEFLEKNGIELGGNPNAKITPEAYTLLEQKFSTDKSVKEQKEKLAEEYHGTRTKRRDEAKEKEEAELAAKIEADKAAIIKAKEEEVSRKKAEEAELKEAEAEKLRLQKEYAKKALANEKVKKEKPKKEDSKEEEPKKEEPKKENPKKEDKKVVAEEPTPEAQAPIEKEPADDKSKGPKVLGTVDLAGMNQKTRPNKKTKKQRAEEKAAKTKKPASSTPESTSEKPKAIESAEEVKEIPTEANDAPKDDNFIKTKITKLTGPKVLGKIELPVDKKPSKKKKPVGSSSDDPKKKNSNRKRRKRIKTDKPAGTATATQGNSRVRDDKKKRPAKNKKVVKAEPTAEEISKQIKTTLARLSKNTKGKGAKYRRQKRDAVSETSQKEAEKVAAEKSIIKVTEFVTASELATMMDVSVNEIIKVCMSLGMFVSINQRLDAETISVVVEEFGFEVDFIGAKEVEDFLSEEEEDKPEDLVTRNPIVTVMGHVDHGKTSLLDYIREANVIAGEAGGITQHIGAYEVELKSGDHITFLDTPGHEAFTAMRARGSKITDIAIIVIAADDSIMPQTKEAISHAQAADVPMIFAINKIDKDGANPERIKEELSQMNILVEDWGGKFQSQEISAKNGTNVEALMEKVILESEMLELKANPNKKASGTILEASLDKGKGYVTKVLIQSGTLKIGDVVLAGTTHGKVKAMFNERGQNIQEAGPATPTLLLGLNSAPQAGDSLRIMNDEKEARNIALKREQLQREQGVRTNKHITLDEIGRRLAIGDFKELNIIIKGDVDGSVEALSDSLSKLSTDEIQVNIIQKSVGQVNEADVVLASASNAIIIAFQVRPSLLARQLADREEIDIRTYSIIYKAIEEIKDAMEGMLSPDTIEEIVCSVEVRDVFKITKVGTVAGCYVLDGKITRNTNVRIIRDGIVTYTGALGSLKRFKDDAKEVNKGYECGLNIENFNDIKVGDIIEGYEEKEVKRKL